MPEILWDKDILQKFRIFAHFSKFRKRAWNWNVPWDFSPFQNTYTVFWSLWYCRRWSEIVPDLQGEDIFT